MEGSCGAIQKGGDPRDSPTYQHQHELTYFPARRARVTEYVLGIAGVLNAEGANMPVVSGVDNSPISRLVVERAIEEARWRDEDLHVVHVSQIPMVYTEVAINWDEVAEAERETVWGLVQPTITDAGVTVQRVDLEGYPPDELVGYANAQAAALLVVGTRGRGDLAALILGSTSHRAIHLSQCDVLVVKANMNQ